MGGFGGGLLRADNAVGLSVIMPNIDNYVIFDGE